MQCRQIAPDTTQNVGAFNLKASQYPNIAIPISPQPRKYFILTIQNTMDVPIAVWADSDMTRMLYIVLPGLGRSEEFEPKDKVRDNPVVISAVGSPTTAKAYFYMDILEKPSFVERLSKESDEWRSSR